MISLRSVGLASSRKLDRIEHHQAREQSGNNLLPNTTENQVSPVPCRTSSAKAQFICLPSYLHGDHELAQRVSYTWSGLSRASHQHPYELSPTSSELLSWIATVEQLISRVRS